MLRTYLKSKIHRAIVTDANLAYEGSVTVDAALLAAADIDPHERVQIVNLHNGSRVETYVMPAKRGSGVICMNGAAARWAEPGDQIIIISYMLAASPNRHRPKVVFVNAKNRMTKIVTRR